LRILEVPPARGELASVRWFLRHNFDSVSDET
jgi:hypothetical protein